MKSKVERQLARERENKEKRASAIKPIAQNRRALFEYEIEEKLEAGLVLVGTEVKSLRHGQASLADGYVALEKGEAYLLDVNIAPYAAGSYNNPDPKRKRKLLLNRRELDRLGTKLAKLGATCIPLSLYFKGPFVKAQIAIVTGKKKYDKRETIKRRESDRETRAAIKANRR
ncbi:MAG: SsrA-binding protein SmpB [Acidobacteria bacterium]|nr:SsrA-binding protein SmpB [Acidobacteriota bacterium]MCG3191850.1 SsrA-binding protein [Thermoanaerobaculia bacterium]MCK6683582.1 SsrA-binding protein SmpB [Thermoanaerobaculia bacterium]